MKPLYSLVEQYRVLERLDIEEIDDESLTATLASLQGEIKEKVVNCALYIRNIETFAASVEAAAIAMALRAKKLNDRAEKIRAYLLAQMKGASILKVPTPEIIVSRRKNPGVLMIREGAKIPDEYMVTPDPPKPYPDKTKIRADLKQGVVIEGCWIEPGERLHIEA